MRSRLAAGCAIAAALTLAAVRPSAAADATPATAPATVAAAAASHAPAGATPVRLSLADAVTLAGGQAPPVTIAASRTQASEARVTQSRSVLLPTLSGDASHTTRTFNKNSLGITFPAVPGVTPIPDLIGPYDIVDARLHVSQTLFDVAGWESWQASKRGAQASHADLDASRESAAQGAAVAYMRLLRAQALLGARRANEALAAELLDLADSQQKAGVAPGIDVTRARTELASAHATVVLARTEEGRAQVALARTLGLDPATTFEPADTLSLDLGASAAPEDSTGAIAMATSRRPELRAADARVQSVITGRRATQSERLPRLDVVADWGANGPSWDSAIPTRDVALAVSLPILDGLRREGRVAEQTAQLAGEQENARDLRDQVSADIETARLDLEGGREQVRLARERLALAEEEVDQARERFSNGVAGNIEVIDAQSSLVRARETEVDARYATALARVELARAVGVVRTMH
jgi:outer membrane protein TolC